MKKELYFINCLTNLHVGSGDVNYNIVDKEVEKDPITGYPMIHASGIKGALRAAYEGEDEASIFGRVGDNTEDKTGSYRFFNAYLLCRPLRASGSVPSVSVTTAGAINDFIALTKAFGFDVGIHPLGEIAFGNNRFLAYNSGVTIEGEATGTLAGQLDAAQCNALKALLGDNFAIAKTFDGYDLPVIARNNLQTENGNLWYEEYVPHGSIFYEIVLTDDTHSPNEVIPNIIQIGGNASVGYGYCEFKQFEQKRSAES